MKVSDLLKHRAENLVKTTEFKQWMSPVVREYWDGFLDRANSRQLFSWVKEFHQPANEDTQLPAEIVLKPEAQALYHELTDKLGEVIHTGH